MWIELAHFALISAMFIALFAGVISLVGAAKNKVAQMAIAKPSSILVCLLVSLSFAALINAFVNDDFSVLYVANHSNTLLPLIYKVSAVWGGHEGSLLLWILMLTWWSALVAVLSKKLPYEMLARILGVLNLVAFGFLLFILATSNPFLRILPAVFEGRDLNPLLQDPGLAIHPPLLYLGYVGFSVAYAFAVAALLSGKLDSAWARWSRPWTTAAWAFLTLGIMIGSWWSYYELGWGGWWFWDPVENASLMPWLVGTALMHSLAVTEKRGLFRHWTILLAISAFSLSLLGTFLVRSGVLTSVHAFATDPSRGLFILLFLVAVIGSSLILFAWRASKLQAQQSQNNPEKAISAFSIFSTESLLLVNNILLVVACATVLLGTLYPLIVDVFNVGKISVGPPYFNAVFVPLMLPILLLVAIVNYSKWKQSSIMQNVLKNKLVIAYFVISLILAISIPIVLNKQNSEQILLEKNNSILVEICLFAGIFLAINAISNTLIRIKQQASLFSVPMAYYGMQIAHFGLAIFVIGATIVSTYEIEKDIKLSAGESVTILDYTFKLNSIKIVEGANYSAAQGDFDLIQNNQVVNKLYPEKRNYFSSTMPMTEAAIDVGFWRDVYVSLAEPIDKDKPLDAWAMRIYYKPCVDWLWLGCLLMAVGGIISILDRRYRKGIVKQ